ncbi:hypothetical protein EMCRGX_G020555 [Ephydatia muelleri]
MPTGTPPELYYEAVNQIRDLATSDASDLKTASGRDEICVSSSSSKYTLRDPKSLRISDPGTQIGNGGDGPWRLQTERIRKTTTVAAPVSATSLEDKLDKLSAQVKTTDAVTILENRRNAQQLSVAHVLYDIEYTCLQLTVTTVAPDIYLYSADL